MSKDNKEHKSLQGKEIALNNVIDKELKGMKLESLALHGFYMRLNGKEISIREVYKDE